MNLVALSRREAEDDGIPCDPQASPSIAICIAYPTGRLHRVNAMGSLLAVLHLRFSDCDGEGRWAFPENKDNNVPMPMTRGQAVDVLEFVARWAPQVETIYAACYGGVSRSRGILAGLAAVYGWDDTDVYRSGQPNAWCKVLLMREARARLGLEPTP